MNINKYVESIQLRILKTALLYDIFYDISPDKDENGKYENGKYDFGSKIINAKRDEVEPKIVNVIVLVNKTFNDPLGQQKLDTKKMPIVEQVKKIDKNKSVEDIKKEFNVITQESKTIDYFRKCENKDQVLLNIDFYITANENDNFKNVFHLLPAPNETWEHFLERNYYNYRHYGSQDEIDVIKIGWLYYMCLYYHNNTIEFEDTVKSYLELTASDGDTIEKVLDIMLHECGTNIPEDREKHYVLYITPNILCFRFTKPVNITIENNTLDFGKYVLNGSGKYDLYYSSEGETKPKVAFKLGTKTIPNTQYLIYAKQGFCSVKMITGKINDIYKYNKENKIKSNFIRFLPQIMGLLKDDIFSDLARNTNFIDPIEDYIGAESLDITMTTDGYVTVYDIYVSKTNLDYYIYEMDNYIPTEQEIHLHTIKNVTDENYLRMIFSKQTEYDITLVVQNRSDYDLCTDTYIEEYTLNDDDDEPEP
jgi:hypothetical protein